METPDYLRGDADFPLWIQAIGKLPPTDLNKLIELTTWRGQSIEHFTADAVAEKLFKQRINNFRWCAKT